MEFFNEESTTTLTQQTAIEHIYSMSDEDIQLLIGFIERMKTGGKSPLPLAEIHIFKEGHRGWMYNYLPRAFDSIFR